MPELFECKCNCRDFSVYKNGQTIICNKCGNSYDILDVMNKYEDEKLRKIRAEQRV